LSRNSLNAGSRFRLRSWRSRIILEIETIPAQTTGNGETLIAGLQHFARLQFDDCFDKSGRQERICQSLLHPPNLVIQTDQPELWSDEIAIFLLT